VEGEVRGTGAERVVAAAAVGGGEREAEAAGGSAFIDASRTSDYQTTRGIREILDRDGNQDDIIALLTERNLPGDEITLNTLAEEIIENPPEIGYLTISNALQWRLQYSRIVTLDMDVAGIVRIV